MKRRYVAGWVVFFGLLLTACNPAQFKKPLEDFKTANLSVRDTYFDQLEITRKTRVEHDILAEEMVMWTDRNLTKKAMDSSAQRVAALRVKPLLPEETMALRKAAFSALDGYASTLLALANNEDTDSIVTNLQGLADDIGKVIEVAENVKLASGLAERFGQIAGPLGSAVNVLGKIAELASAAIRETAIRETVVTADSDVRDLLTVLKNEAVWAQKEARDKASASKTRMKKFIDQRSNRLSASTKVLVTKRAESFYATADLVKQQKDIGLIFDGAITAQGELLKKAALPDYDGWINEIREFKEQVEEAREAIVQLKGSL